MNHTWNKFIYKIASPIYDMFFNSGVFLKARKKVFQSISFKDNQKILFIGVGTGADLEIINYSNLDVTAIDYSSAMLNKAKEKFENSTINFLEMDAQSLTFENEAFDYVVASLVLSVVPDDSKTFQEMIRVLKPHGKIIIFDKFAPKNTKMPLTQRFLRPLIRVLGTDIGRSFEKLLSEQNKAVIVEQDTSVMMNGLYRKILISKIS
ncbi:class I SAM-dependent methyltransferase [Lysinibacillus sp. KU-BSD001]|uniref:class I SAM-dependent methyltransferase n=1 Tax=Lysinibacillus sp. KU-BSD001 TaxID=3141328 RepID=UPI0036EE71AA